MNLSWMASAACAGESCEIFFPVKISPHTVARAQVICADCSVVQQCRQYADATRASDGIWGGEVRQPWHHRRYRPRSVPLRGCGTEAAYYRHLRHGERPCHVCAAAAARADKARRAQRKAAAR